ncbi:MAG TPA: cyclopropane-fatty-acyl-phospholipid synthase family protein [Caulobacteraceae bacterium]
MPAPFLPTVNAPRMVRTVIDLAQRNWRFGGLEVGLPSGQRLRIGGHEPGPEARLDLRDYRVFKRILSSADVGLAEGYMAGEWDTPDLHALLEALSLNFDRLAELLKGNALVRLVHAVGHALNANTRSGSRRNIEAHYDLGNAFYEKWLDPTLSYSSALFERAGQPLEQAQTNKYAALARRLELGPDHHVLEIGCGWGGFAEFAAKEIGAQVTGVTISPAQFEFARRRMFEKGLAEKADIRLVDYRDVEGSFDRVASIEMFEAVGERYWPAYFAKIAEVLKDGGRAGLQIITIRDDLFAGYRAQVDFVQRYIFPGGMLPSEARLKQEAARAGLDWQESSSFGQDYARTLSEWADRFQQAWREITPLGFDERFRRLWHFYLSYCRAGFVTGRTDVVQLTLAAP